MIAALHPDLPPLADDSELEEILSIALTMADEERPAATHDRR
jgi:hypothetical protein